MGHVNIVEYLITAGANINLQTFSGMSSLMIACDNNHNEVAIKLVSEGASLTLESDEGLTANRIAYLNRNLQLINYFIGQLKIESTGTSQNVYHAAEAC